MMNSTTNDTVTTQKPASFRHFLLECAEMIKFEHTIFALPFALSGLLLGSRELPSISTFFWTIIAFTGARTAAMVLNRLIDASVDALNPRTASRSIPSGRISKTQALFLAVFSFSIMIFAASQLPVICLYLSPIAVIWLSFYSFTKRFTWLCHLVLGIALGGATLGGWLAAGGALNVAAPWILALAVTTWVAGFDIIYALQDINFDQEQKLFSIPARFGAATALAFSSLLHVMTSACLVILGVILNLGSFYWLGATLVSIVLVYEHKLVKPDDFSKVNAAFFTTNGIISIATFIAILLDKVFPIHF